MAFFETLPDDSATRRTFEDNEVSMNVVLLAQIIDTLKMIAYAQGGKRFPKDKLLAPMLSKENRRKAEKMEELKKFAREQLGLSAKV